MPHPSRTIALALLVSLSLLHQSIFAIDDEPADDGAFSFTTPVVCGSKNAVTVTTSPATSSTNTWVVL